MVNNVLLCTWENKILCVPATQEEKDNSHVYCFAQGWKIIWMADTETCPREGLVGINTDDEKVSGLPP